MKKRKSKQHIRVTAIRREKPDLKRLARALIEVAEQELQQQDDFIKFMKSHSPKVSIREVDDWTVFDLGTLPFAAFNSDTFFCRLSRDICVNEFNLEGPKKWPKGEDGTIILQNRNIEEWKRLGLSSLKYVIKFYPKA